MGEMIDILAHYERNIPSDLKYAVFPDPSVQKEHGFVIDRLIARVPEGHFFLHRFKKAPGSGFLHTHNWALSAHVLGPGMYETLFAENSKTHSRIICKGSFYYEMRTPELQHAVRPLDDDPIYSVAMWIDFPTARSYPEKVSIDKLVPSNELLQRVMHEFDSRGR